MAGLVLFAAVRCSQGCYGRKDVMPMVVDTMTIGGLGIWRMTQGVYRFDPDLFEALWTTPRVNRLP